MTSPVTISTAGPGDWHEVARWTFDHFREPFATDHAERLEALLSSGELGGATLVARRNDKAVGGLAVQYLPGGTAVVLLPGGDTEEVRDALVDAALNRFHADGISVAQVFLEPYDLSRAAVLLRANFISLTDLLSLSREKSLPLPPVDPRTKLKFLPYHEIDPAIFADTLLSTYIDSQDAPEASVGRSASEVLAGYRFGQPNSPKWWLAVNDDGLSVGVILMSLKPETDPEVTYLGVVPAARGCGVGGNLLRFAIDLATSASRSLTLSVDERNTPARRLYDRAGFRVGRRQRVFLWRAGKQL